MTVNHIEEAANAGIHRISFLPRLRRRLRNEFVELAALLGISCFGTGRSLAYYFVDRYAHLLFSFAQVIWKNLHSP